MKRKPRAEPPPFGGNPEARAPTSRSQTGLPHRDVEQPCFFLPERAVRPTKKAPEECSAGTAGCAQGSRTASTDPRSAAAAAPADAPCGCTGRSPTLRTGSDTAGSGGCRRLPAGRRASPPAGAPGTAMPAAPRCPPHSLFEPVLAVSAPSCQPPSFVPFSGGFSPLYHIRAVIYQRAEGNVPLCRLRLL